MSDSARRLREPTGEVVRVGLQQRWFDDVYHLLLGASWPRLLGLVAALYVVTNAFFACLYLLGGDCIAGASPGSFHDAFFFSVQTLSTIGYGTMAPKGTYGSILVSFEALVGLIGVTMTTGLVFSKFARPTAAVIFSTPMVITPRDGRPCLMFRMGNARGNDVVEAAIRLSLIREEVTLEGERARRILDLKLLRNETPLFALSWTAFHFIDEESPLHGETEATLRAKKARFIVTFTGIDGTFAQSVHARHIYTEEDVVWGGRFVDIMSTTESGGLQVDYGKFHDVHRPEGTGTGTGGDEKT